MMKPFFFLFIFIAGFSPIKAQVTLDADGEGDTYELINSVLAPGYNVVEVPDCAHPDFGRHIDEVMDNDLGIYVFRFHIHVTPDNDRCKTFDRQRNEIKSYDKSPDNLKAIEGETVEYKWKFKLDSAFQPSTSFTHIHQLKAVGGSQASMPLITLTPRKSSTNSLQIRYAKNTSQSTIRQVPLLPFLGEWVEVYEKVRYGEDGAYEITITRLSDQETLLEYSNESIRMWKTGASFIRPKWGIYRSLNVPSDLRDEEVLFANFSVEELNVTSTNHTMDNALMPSVHPNPSKGTFTLSGMGNHMFKELAIYSADGKVFKRYSNTSQSTFDISESEDGLYFISFTKSDDSKQVIKFLKIP